MNNFFVFAVMSVVLVSPALAEDNGIPSGGPGALNAPPEVVSPLRDMRSSTLNEIKGIRENALNAIREQKQEFEQRIKDARDAFQKTIEAQREAAKHAIEVKREDMKNAIEAKRTELQQRLQNFKDEHKKQIVERLQSNFNDLNKRTVDRFSENLDTLDGILVNISSRADKAEANGKDVTTVRTAITAAKTAIVSVRALVTVQSGKVYSINLQSEATAKADASSTKQALEADLKAVRAGVQAAHAAVTNAARLLGQILDVDRYEWTIPTSTATSTQ